MVHQEVVSELLPGEQQADMHGTAHGCSELGSGKQLRTSLAASISASGTRREAPCVHKFHARFGIELRVLHTTCMGRWDQHPPTRCCHWRDGAAGPLTPMKVAKHAVPQFSAPS